MSSLALAAEDRLFLVLPVRRDPVLRPAVHAQGPDLQLDRLAAGADDRGVQRLVHVELRHRDVVLEPSGDGVPPRVDGAESRVAVADVVHQDADADQVVDVVEADVPGDHLLVDRVVVLRPAGHRGLDLGLAQVGADVLDDFLEEDVAPRRPAGHQPGDLVEPLGVQRLEGEILQLPLDRVHAEPVRQRSVDLQDLPGLALLLLPLQVAQRPHIVQPVGELDDQHADVAGHRDHHLADGLGLGRLTVLDLVQLGDAIHQRRDVLAELPAQLGQRVRGVLDRVVQQRRADGLGVHAQLGEDGRHGQRMGNVRVAAEALLIPVPVGGRIVGPLDQPDVGLRVRRADGLDERLEHRVQVGAALRAEPRQPPPDPGTGCRDLGRAGRGRGGGSGPAAPGLAAGPLDWPSWMAWSAAVGARPVRGSSAGPAPGEPSPRQQWQAGRARGRARDGRARAGRAHDGRARSLPLPRPAPRRLRDGSPAARPPGQHRQHSCRS